MDDDPSLLDPATSTMSLLLMGGAALGLGAFVLRRYRRKAKRAAEQNKGDDGDDPMNGGGSSASDGVLSPAHSSTHGMSPIRKYVKKNTEFWEQQKKNQQLNSGVVFKSRVGTGVKLTHQQRMETLNKAFEIMDESQSL